MAKCYTQTDEPKTDNSSPCDFFMSAECVILKRNSNLIKKTKDANMSEYTLALENEIRKLKLEYKNLKKVLDNLIIMFPEANIGVYE